MPSPLPRFRPSPGISFPHCRQTACHRALLLWIPGHFFRDARTLWSPHSIRCLHRSSAGHAGSSLQLLLSYAERGHLWLARDSIQAGAGARPLIGLPERRLPARATPCGGVSRRESAGLLGEEFRRARRVLFTPSPLLSRTELVEIVKC